jgi:hypothetical protein
MVKWNEYFSSPAMHHIAEGSQTMSRVDEMSTKPALDIVEENAIFAGQVKKEFINNYHL